MTAKDLNSNLKPAMGLDVQAIAADGTVVGNIIDMQGHRSLEFMLLSGASTDGTHTLLVEHGDDAALADAAVVPAGEMIGAAAALDGATEANSVSKQGYAGQKRYVRASLVSTAVTSGGSFGVLAIQDHSHRKPVV